MNRKIITHADVRKELYRKHPGLEDEVKAEIQKLRIAERISELRKKAHLTQKALAKKIGTTQSAVARMESSQYEDYKVSTLQRIAKVTGGTFKIAA